ncbi:beta-mannosidase [Flavobacterium rakeshii]|uniref:Beta-mannosidase n=1 Tax=Flavobacterium rakeshii TaxID=1038845 RepID=A0A6N8H705_9FLAO|nr:glycosyl hydrolase [Flavobacterium rakeshii]MUV02404.1 beta-mannosidase [Flavobacterium rakeshii]
MKNKISILLLALAVVSCGKSGNKEEVTASQEEKEMAVGVLADKNATAQTVALYKNLFKLREKGYMFGHQDDLAYGVEWKYEEGRSDVKDVTGDYPAVYGWDIGRIENNADKNLDGVPFDKMRQFIKEVYDRGGVNTVSWHVNNPLSDGDAWDNPEGTVASVLPGGSKHEVYKGWMDNAATFFLSLKGSDGNLVPILYRPYHEFTGDWFWWCKNTTSPEQFKELWKFTVDYFEQKGVHNLIYVYNTSDANVKAKADFLEYYPGDEYVDMMSFDAYQMGEGEKLKEYTDNVHSLIGVMQEAADEHGKLTALAETGYEAIPYEKWWTEILTNAIGDYKISYVLLWRNHGWNEYMDPPRMHYYAPYSGHAYKADFVEYYNQDSVLFQKEVTKENLYQ